MYAMLIPIWFPAVILPVHAQVPPLLFILARHALFAIEQKPRTFLADTGASHDNWPLHYGSLASAF